MYTQTHIFLIHVILQSYTNGSKFQKFMLQDYQMHIQYGKQAIKLNNITFIVLDKIKLPRKLSILLRKHRAQTTKQ